MRALDPVDADIDTCWGAPVDAGTPTKRRREPSSASAEEGYESVSDEDGGGVRVANADPPPAAGDPPEAEPPEADPPEAEPPEGDDGQDHHLTLFATRKLSASGADSEDSGLSRDGPPSLASSTASAGHGAPQHEVRPLSYRDSLLPIRVKFTRVNQKISRTRGFSMVSFLVSKSEFHSKVFRE